MTMKEGTAGFSEVLGSVCERLSCGQRKFLEKSANQIPAVRLDRQELIFGDDGPYKTIRESTRREFEIELNVICRTIVQVNKSPGGLENPLEEIVTWPKGEDGVQRSNIATSCREYERVGVAILNQASF